MKSNLIKIKNETTSLIIGLKLSKFNFELSKTEAIMCSKAYFTTELIECFDDVCIFKMNTTINKINKWLFRLGFVREAYLISFKDSWESVFLKAKLFNLNVGDDSCFKIYNKTHNSSKNELENYVSQIIKKGLSSKVCVKNPDLSFFLFDNYVGLRFWINKEDFESRRAHLKKAPHPTTLNPRLARSMINLASAKHEVLDPFCGSGGILEESKFISLNYYGTDISKNMIKRAELNLGTDKNLFCMNAFSWKTFVECVVCDLPYGKSSFLESSIEDLIFKFFNHFDNLTERIVVCLPSTIQLNNFLKETNWIKVCSFDIYVHKSLTRTIYVIHKRS